MILSLSFEVQRRRVATDARLGLFASAASVTAANGVGAVRFGLMLLRRLATAAGVAFGCEAIWCRFWMRGLLFTAAAGLLDDSRIVVGSACHVLLSQLWGLDQDRHDFGRGSAPPTHMRPIDPGMSSWSAVRFCVSSSAA